MSLRLYNSRTRTVEPFAPLDPQDVRIYVCGLTPSAEAHLGHARSFLFFDVLRRYLTKRGYRVNYVQNVTDIDDRSIEAARTSGTPWYDVVEGYFTSFKRSMDRLRVLEPDREPRATQYVPQIVAMIGELVASGHAYAEGDGVYFAVRSFPRYGALSGRNLDELQIGARIAPGEHKRDPLDFALWKFAKPGEPAWPSPWGDGRPGWHIECSAMSHALLGEPFDIHGGGFDLIFPHHENEIAQTEALYGPPMANVWMHGGLLNFDGRKMSKSLGNFEPLSALLDRHDPQAIRLLFLQAGYRKPQNFTEFAIEGMTTALRRLQAAYDELRTAPAAAPDASHARDESEAVARLRGRFEAALDDDLNTSEAVTVLFGLASSVTATIAAGDASAAAAFMHEAMTVLGISPHDRAPGSNAVIRAASTTDLAAEIGGVRYSIVSRGAEHLPNDALERLRAALGDLVPLDRDAAPDAVNAIVEARLRAKSARDFALADRLREALAGIGVAIADGKPRDGRGEVTWSAGV